MRIAIGFDPDKNGSGVAIVSATQVLAVGIVHSSNSVEAQCKALRPALEQILLPWAGKVVPAAVEYPRDWGRARANDLIDLGIVSGRASEVLTSMGCPARLVSPNDWKGSLKKPVSHRRTLDYYGWCYRDSAAGPKDVEFPVGLSVVTDVPDSSLKEILDAIGLARWAFENLATKKGK